MKKYILMTLMWILLWQHAYGISLTLAKLSPTTAKEKAKTKIDSITIYEAASYEDEMPSGKATEKQEATLTFNSTDYERSKAIGNNTKICDNINENDKNANKLSHNQQDQQQSEFMNFGGEAKMKTCMPQRDAEPKSQPVLMSKDQLNKTDDKISQDMRTAEKIIKGNKNEQETQQMAEATFDSAEDAMAGKEEQFKENIDAAAFNKSCDKQNENKNEDINSNHYKGMSATSLSNISSGNDVGVFFNVNNEITRNNKKQTKVSNVNENPIKIYGNQGIMVKGIQINSFQDEKKNIKYLNDDNNVNDDLTKDDYDGGNETEAVDTEQQQTVADISYSKINNFTEIEEDNKNIIGNNAFNFIENDNEILNETDCKDNENELNVTDCDNNLAKNEDYDEVVADNETISSNKSHSNEININDNKNSSSTRIELKNGNTADLKAIMQQQLIQQMAIKYKQIPRITYFTCRYKHPAKESNSNPSQQFIPHRNLNMLKRLLLSSSMTNSNSSEFSEMPDLMLKVVKIDHLIVSKRQQAGNRNIQNKRGRGGYGNNKRYSAQSQSNSFTNANWLEQVLHSETLRQLVVVDLGCTLASRRLLEMASNKALFNSMYHWLLMEDYEVDQQTEIDETNGMTNKFSSNATDTTKPSATEVLRGKPESNFNVSKMQKDVSTLSITKSADNISNTDDIETIEEFLEKLNININTELILAKYYKQVQGLSKTSASSTNSDKSSNSSSNSMKAQCNNNVCTEASLMNGANKDEADMSQNKYEIFEKIDYYNLYDVWSPGLQYGGKLNITGIGNFNRKYGLQLHEWFRTTSTISRRINMNLAEIRCLVVVTHKNLSESLESYLTTHYDTHLDSMNRFNFALLSHVREIFNLSFILSKTSTWGYLKNGKFDGMIGALVRKQADIGGSPIFFRIERAKVIDYTARTWVARPCFIFRHPRSTKKDRIVFLQPFTNDVWILLAIFGWCTIVLLWFLTSLERQLEANMEIVSGSEQKSIKELSAEVDNTKSTSVVKGKSFKRLFVRWGGAFCGQNVDNNSSKRRVGIFFESFLFYMGSICQQGLSFSTRFFSGRCVVVTSLLFAFAIYQFYSASIVGTLLMEKPKTIRTLRDLIHSSLEIGIEDIVYNRDFFLRTKDPDAQELYAKKVTSVPQSDTSFVDAQADAVATPPPTAAVELTKAQIAKAYRDILHSHETGAHAKNNEASNWYDPEYGVTKIKKGHFAFHVDVATAYKIIADTFSEKEICDLKEIQLFPPQKMVSIVQKGSPLRKIITYGLRRVTEVGITDYQRKVWHSARPRCVKSLHPDDLKVDMQTFSSALLVLVFGFGVSLSILGLEIMHFKLWKHYTELEGGPSNSTTTVASPSAVTVEIEKL